MGCGASVIRDPNAPPVKWSLSNASAYFSPEFSPDWSTILIRDYNKNSMLIAVDVESGEQRWSVQNVSSFAGRESDGTPVYAGKSMWSPDGSAVLVRDYDDNARVRALDMSTGRKLWSTRKVSEYFACVYGEVFIFRDYDSISTFKGVNLHTGLLLWSMTDVNEMMLGPWQKIAALTGMVLFRDRRNTSMIKVIDVNSGHQKWTMPKVSDRETYLTQDGAALLVRDYDDNSKVKAFDMSTGMQLWSVSKVSERCFLGVFEQVLTFRNYDSTSTVKGVDLHTGEQLWSVTDVGDTVGCVSDPAASADTQLFWNSGDSCWAKIIAIDVNSGRHKWTIGEVSEHKECSPVINADRSTILVRASYDGDRILRAFDMDYGEQRWGHKYVSNHKDCPLVISPDGSKVLCRDFNDNAMLKAIDMDSGQQRWSAKDVRYHKDCPLVISSDGSKVLCRDLFNIDVLRAIDMNTGDQLWALESMDEGSGQPWISPGRSIILCRDWNLSRRNILKAFDISHSPRLLANADTQASSEAST